MSNIFGIFDIFNNLSGLLNVGNTDNAETDLIKQLEEFMDRLKPYAKMYAALTGDQRVSGAILATDLIVESAKKLQDKDVSAEDKISIIEKLKQSL